MSVVKSRRALMSRIRGWPKKRLYSRLKLVRAFIAYLERRTGGIEPAYSGTANNSGFSFRLATILEL
jgi:hypothetical protein